LGLQFNLSESFAVSVGGLYGNMGILPQVTKATLVTAIHQQHWEVELCGKFLIK
jgi:hypothetical protein